jgi:hypothetical protein
LITGAISHNFEQIAERMNSFGKNEDIEEQVRLYGTILAIDEEGNEIFELVSISGEYEK